MASVTFKQEVLKVIDQLPETAGWNELAEHARYLAAVARGREQARRGEFASDEEVKRRFASWGVDVEA